MLTFDPAQHEYRWNGRVVPSVTQILKSLGLIDATWYTDEARDRGSMIHLATALDDRGELDESSVDERIAGYLAAWRLFKAESGASFTDIEIQLYSDYGYAGTPDRIGTLRGRSVFDIKNGEPEPWHALQTAAYAFGCSAGSAAVMSRYCIYLRDNGTYRLIQHDRSTDIAVWLSCLNLYNWKANNA